MCCTCRSSFHSAVHSGRLLKIMLEGANGMAGLWLSFFREIIARRLVTLFVMLPLSMRRSTGGSAPCCIALVAGVRRSSRSLVLRRTEGMQGTRRSSTRPPLRNGPPMRSATSRSSRVSRASTPRTAAMRALIDRLLQRAASGAVVVGAGCRGDAGVGDPDDPVDLRARPVAAFSGASCEHGADRRLHEFRDADDHPPRPGGGLRQRACSSRCRSCATSSAVLDTGPDGPRPARRDATPVDSRAASPSRRSAFPTTGGGTRSRT